jgi:DNA-binding response OmpR family regulator
MASSTGAERRSRILVVDDEEDVRVLVARLLGAVGHEVESAADGAEALERIAQHRPDLVVLDLLLPGIDGWDVLRHLQAEADPPPVVIVTGRGDFATLTRGVRAGASAYVVKPFRFHELVATCQRVLLAVASGRRASSGDRRRESRRFLIVTVDLLGDNGQPAMAGELIELSAGGARIDLAEARAVGETLRLVLRVGSPPLMLDGQVCWRSATAHGFVHGLELRDLGPEGRTQIADLLAPAP